MTRLLWVLACGAIAMLPSAVALAAPSPSPALDKILMSPPGTGFVEANPSIPGLFEGPFNAKGYTTITNPANPTRAQQTLEHDGFIAGFGRTWVQQAIQHIYVEAVIAFNGADGAKTWLRQSELADMADPHYQHAITISGIDAYYGAALFDISNGAYVNAYVFLKGNDAFLVTTVAATDDKGDSSAAQTRVQYDAAPPFTIPPSQWPGALAAAPSPIVNATGRVLIGGFVVVLVALLVTLLVYRARAGRVAASIPIPGVTLSADGHFWWDGQAWRDAEHDVPPSAQRSGDGSLWWDGRAWRAVHYGNVGSEL